MFTTCYGITLGSDISNYSTDTLLPFTKKLYKKYKSLGFERTMENEMFYYITDFIHLPRYRSVSSIEDNFDSGFVAVVNSIVYKISMSSGDIDDDIRSNKRNSIGNFVSLCFTGGIKYIEIPEEAIKAINKFRSFFQKINSKFFFHWITFVQR